MFRDIRERVGRLDGLVNNAARFTRIDPFDITEQDWDFIHSVNLKATFFSCQQGALVMREHGGGKIVNISSMGGIRPWPEHVHYCASKAGVIHMTRALSIALAPEISVNSVAPGVIPFAEADTNASAIGLKDSGRPSGHGRRNRGCGRLLPDRHEVRDRTGVNSRRRVDSALVIEQSFVEFSR